MKKSLTHDSLLRRHHIHLHRPHSRPHSLHEEQDDRFSGQGPDADLNVIDHLQMCMLKKIRRPTQARKTTEFALPAFHPRLQGLQPVGLQEGDKRKNGTA